ncbi:MAG: YciI family protein [Acidimicrobiales bacterium]
MNYMLLLYSAADAGPKPGSPEQAAEMPQWLAYSQALVDAGVMVAGEPLHPVSTATTVRLRGGEVLTTDGPFAETKEQLGGYYIIDVPDLDAALDWAAKTPLTGYGSVEVRPIMEIPSL